MSEKLEEEITLSLGTMAISGGMVTMLGFSTFFFMRVGQSRGWFWL